MNDVSRPVERIAERRVYQNRFITVYDDDVRYPTGRQGRFLRITEGDGSPAVVALPHCGELIALVRTYRYAIQAFEWSLPRGFANAATDSTADVVRELAEELGSPPIRLEQLGSVRANSGLLSGSADVFMAEYASTALTPQDDEIHDIRWISVPNLLAEIRSGQIADGFTLSAICLAMAAGKVRG